MTPLLIFATLTPVFITTYHSKYDFRTTKSGAIYDPRKLSVAVPRPKWSTLKGRVLVFHYEGRSVTVRVTDTCGPGVRNYDLSRAAWDALTRNAYPSRVKGLMGVE